MERKWLMLAILLFSSASYFFAMQSVPPVLLQIMDHFDISHAQAGMLMFFVSIPAVALALPAGTLVVRWGAKRVATLGLCLATLGVLTTYLADSFALLALGRLVLGSGGILVIISTYSSVTQWFSRDELGKAQGISTLNMPFAIIIALNILPIVAEGFGWRTSFLIATIALAASTLTYLLAFDDKVQVRQATGSWRAIRNRQAWLVGLVWGLFVLVYQSYATWAGTFYIELKDIPASTAFFMASFMTVTAIPIGPLAGMMSDRVGKRKLVLVITTFLMGVSFLLIPGLDLPLLMAPVALFALAATFLPPALFALPSEVLSPELAGVGFGIMYVCWSVGTSSGPAIIGWIRDTFAGELPIYLVLALFSFLALGIASRLKTR